SIHPFTGKKQMPDDPYLNTLLMSALAVIFIIITSLGLGALARFIAKLSGSSKLKQADAFTGYLFASPWIVGFIIFVLIPLFTSLYWSFTDYRIPNHPEWLGFENYAKLLLSDSGFRASLVNTLFLTVIGLPLQVGVALLLAVLLNQKMRGERIFRMSFYLPVVLGFNAAVLLCWRLMLAAGNGIINQVIRALSAKSILFSYLNRAIIYVVEVVNAFFLGITNQNFTLFNKVLDAGFPAANRVPMWVQTPLWSKMSVIILIVWGCGTMMLIFLAGLNNIPKELHEAAEVDGAGGWARFWRISFPLITPYIFYNLIVGMIAALQIFEPIYVLYRDSATLAPSAFSMVYYLWMATFRFNEIGYGSAISWLILIIILIVTLFQFRAQNRWVNYELY
ncbi:MAG: sugar ABC transporter permease, partial [Anaerolineaceae bacterium]